MAPLRDHRQRKDRGVHGADLPCAGSGGRQVIVLIPEISLTYQTVMRFYRRFGNRVSIINSRLSAGERYDQLARAAREISTL